MNLYLTAPYVLNIMTKKPLNMFTVQAYTKHRGLNKNLL